MMKPFQSVIMHNFSRFCSKVSQFDEEKLYASLDDIFDGYSFRNDIRWESIMDEIREIDPFTTSNELNLFCAAFIAEYVVKKYEDLNIPSPINFTQKEGDPDLEFAYLLVQNVIERSDDEDEIKNALLCKAHLAMLLKDDNSFNNTFDRVLTDFDGKLNNEQLIPLYHSLIMIGSWHKLPQIQRHNGKTTKDLYERHSEVQMLFDICKCYNFKLPEIIPTDSVNLTSDFKVKSIKTRLKKGTLQPDTRVLSSKCMEYVNFIRDQHDKLINDPNNEWHGEDIEENGEYAVRRQGALCLMTPNPVKPQIVLVGPYMPGRIHCGKQTCAEYDEESGVSTWYNQQILLDKQKNGNFAGSEYVWLNRIDKKGVNLGYDIKCAFEYIMEVE